MSKSDRDKARKAVEDAFVRLTEGGAILEKGARWGVSVVRSDGSETVWMKKVQRMSDITAGPDMFSPDFGGESRRGQCGHR